MEKYNFKEYRIKEEKYKSGKIKFLPQGYFEEQWKTLSLEVFGFNLNGLNFCETLEEAQNVIDRFRLCLLNETDKVVEEKIHYIN
jgi:hypothetical protein